jgi:hypothetical protein
MAIGGMAEWHGMAERRNSGYGGMLGMAEWPELRMAGVVIADGMVRNGRMVEWWEGFTEW